MDFLKVLVEAPQMQEIVATSKEEKIKLFNRVKSKNWKMPINKTITIKNEDEIYAIQDAVSYFVGGRCDVDIVGTTSRGLRVNFYSLGYYSNIES